MNNKNILVLAYQLSPSKGSEYSVAWNYVTRMSKYNHLTVIYGVSGEHMGDCDEMEKYASEKGVPNVDFVCVKPNRWTNALNWCNRHNFLNYTFYFAYHRWLDQVYKLAKKIVKSRRFDLVHFVGPIGYREPGYLWKLELPYMWGSIGGANSINVVLQKNASTITRLKFAFRNVTNNYQLKHKKNIRKALDNTDLLLTATTENQYVFKRFFNKESIYLPENSITGDANLDRSKFANTDKYHFVIVGNLVQRKAVDILFKALALIKNRDKLVVDVVGDGPMRSNLKTYAQEHNLVDMIVWHGQLPRNHTVQIFNMAHIHVTTSLSEGNPTTIWEAMSNGVPTMSFDHCGMHDTICKRCGIKIPIVSYEQCVADLAKNIDALVEHPERFEQLANGVLECAKKQTWDAREQFLLNCYDLALENFKKKNK